MTKSSSYFMVARPEIDSVKALRGKKLGINSFGSSADYAAYAAVSRSGMDPNKDLTILAIGGGTPERLAAVVSGSVDATVITSPAEYAAEKQGLRVIMSAQELGQLVRIPITGIGATQKKIEQDPDEIVRLLARAAAVDACICCRIPNTASRCFKESCTWSRRGGQIIQALSRSIQSGIVSARWHRRGSAGCRHFQAEGKTENPARVRRQCATGALPKRRNARDCV